MVSRLGRALPLTLSLLFLGTLSPAQADGVLEQMENEVASIVKTSKGAIVSIEDERAVPPRRAGTDFDSRQLAAQQGKRGPSPFDRMNAPKSGSGFSIGNGYVVTTADVVEGMQHPLVVADDGTRYRAKLVGLDTELNLGLLQLPAKASLPALKMGNSDSVTAGNFAIAIGNQTGHANSVALTMVSGVRNEGTFTGERFYPALIQVAGTIGAGTSGAPMLNARGEVIGVIAGVPAGEWTETQIYSDQPLNFLPAVPGSSAQSHTPGGPNAQPDARPQGNPGRGRGGGAPFGFGPGQTPLGQPNSLPINKVFLRSPATGAGFAIPINDLQFSIKELMTNGKIVRTWVGVDLRPDRKTTEDDGIIKTTRFVRVRGVYPDSPAQKGGLQPDDILVELNAKPVLSMAETRAAFMRLHPADKLTVTFQRNGANQTVILTIEARPEKIVPPASQPNQSTRRAQ